MANHQTLEGVNNTLNNINNSMLQINSKTSEVWNKVDDLKDRILLAENSINSIKETFESTVSEICENKAHESRKLFIKWTIPLFGVIAILLCFMACFLISDSVLITNEGLVIAFIGILVTFVVITSYIQFATIRNDTNKSVEEIRAGIIFWANSKFLDYNSQLRDYSDRKGRRYKDSIIDIEKEIEQLKNQS